MFRKCLGSVRYKHHQITKSIYGKVVVQPREINHEFHKHIKWAKPEELVPWHPQRSCDLRPLPAVDPSTLKVEFRPFVEIINRLPEEQRKVFTIEYGGRKDKTNVIMEDTLSLVKQHMYDRNSLPVKIARATVTIRNFQEVFANYNTTRKSGKHRQACKEMIEKRRKYLTWLRESDYKCFEWVLELMGILYKPDRPECLIQRRASLNLLVNMFCNELRDKKMREYKDFLESEKIPFLENKLNTLIRIKEDEASINIQCSVEQDIEETKKMLENLKVSHMTVHPVDRSSQPLLNN